MLIAQEMVLIENTFRNFGSDVYLMKTQQELSKRASIITTRKFPSHYDAGRTTTRCLYTGYSLTGSG
ncbi:hypothetical protein CS542_10795 [Pedobacter sp. IW39]|nr:hypothetical protein CS542_10795 [Pedobacter sp. IW39]